MGFLTAWWGGNRKLKIKNEKLKIGDGFVFNFSLLIFNSFGGEATNNEK